MADTVAHLRQWLNTLPDSEEIGINDGGLTLEVVDDPSVPHAPDCPYTDGDDVECTCWKSAYFELGGLGYDGDDENGTKVRQTTCRHCEQDIENVSPFNPGAWRDRGNNTHCPTPEGDAGQHHEPVAE